MKYLKRYKAFEESEFDVSSTDSVDVKVSKDKLNDLKKQISEYNQKKGQIDNVFKRFKDPKQIETEIEKIMGKDNKNPFLVEYTHIARLNNDINIQHEANIKDKLSLDDFNKELGLAKDNDLKKIIQSKISDINNRMSERNKKIADIKKKSTESEKKHREKMKKMESELRDYIKKISSN